MRRKRNSSVRFLLHAVLAVFVFLLTIVANRHPVLTEQLYSQKIYYRIAQVLSTISSVFPFSLDDVFYILLIIILLLLVLFVAIRKLSFKMAAKSLVVCIAWIYILFYTLWGFNYYRQDLNDRLGLKEQAPSKKEFVHQLEKLIESTNRTFVTFDNFNKFEIDSLIENSYKELASIIKIKYPAGNRKDKTITFSQLFAMAGISGYYGPFFNEVHVNSKVLPVEYPFVLAHEKAHQFGITSEAEANFYAWMVCTNSKSKQLQYSANMHVLRYFLFQAYRIEEYPEVVSKIDENVKMDFRRIRENWSTLRNEKVDKVASKVNDAYLKTNRVVKGIEDYKGVVKFIMDFSQDSIFKNRVSKVTVQFDPK